MSEGIHKPSIAILASGSGSTAEALSAANTIFSNIVTYAKEM